MSNYNIDPFELNQIIFITFLPPLRRIETYYFSFNVFSGGGSVNLVGNYGSNSLLQRTFSINIYYSSLSTIICPLCLSVISVVRHFISNCENLAMLRSGYKPAFQWLLVNIARPSPFRDIKMFIPSSGTTREVFLSLMFADFFVCGTIHGLHFLY